MPTLGTGSRRTSEHGFSLVELLAVLAILSLMVGAVVLNLPESRRATDRDSEAMAAQMSRFVDAGALAGDVRAIGFGESGVALFRHDGHAWRREAERPWPGEARIRVERDGARADLPPAARPELLFEPFGAVPDFALVMRAADADYVVTTDDEGRIVRVVER
ncbi:MAG: prepilin-type N-terminal cleavage/methylation domain-containing protein [Pseudomonadota bacterium]